MSWDLSKLSIRARNLLENNKIENEEQLREAFKNRSIIRWKRSGKVSISELMKFLGIKQSPYYKVKVKRVVEGETIEERLVKAEKKLAQIRTISSGERVYIPIKTGLGFYDWCRIWDLWNEKRTELNEHSWQNWVSVTVDKALKNKIEKKIEAFKRSNKL